MAAGPLFRAAVPGLVAQRHGQRAAAPGRPADAGAGRGRRALAADGRAADRRAGAGVRHRRRVPAGGAAGGVRADQAGPGAAEPRRGPEAHVRRAQPGEPGQDPGQDPAAGGAGLRAGAGRDRGWRAHRLCASGGNPAAGGLHHPAHVLLGRGDLPGDGGGGLRPRAPPVHEAPAHERRRVPARVQGDPGRSGHGRAPPRGFLRGRVLRRQRAGAGVDRGGVLHPVRGGAALRRPRHAAAGGGQGQRPGGGTHPPGRGRLPGALGLRFGPGAAPVPERAAGPVYRPDLVRAGGGADAVGEGGVRGRETLPPAGFLPSPACGRGAGVRVGTGNIDGLHFVDMPALTPTLSRKREREYGGVRAKANANA
ncbi:hypothetical protein CBM2592_B110126 [Cupriavidus taiwanensis]|nr:hypothetical protein CBM2592_B110126 [Cupriavidus taiwanensis]SOY63681.1 hypothetical protein CBM2588_B140121 [Cupriavidus taiwanensis]SOY93793.1 hypothetical protein CBM2591_B100099 [Cupriavidus taiwanensis]SOZ69042.1 hypothetical protein CBM2617_B140011 [Cupriavidus taiwanensis]SOZ85693.1 hypothetical protein CBM2618_B140010 [Cupriavidus taiwanensis]